MSGLMVVDDEEGVRRSLKRVLERDGYEVILAQNGDEAISIIRNNGKNIETVISDYRMPGIDGLETLIEIGRINMDITRIMLTGYATMASAIEAVNEGIDGFLTKPFENDELKAKVREYTIKKRLKQFVSEQVMNELQRDGGALLPRRLDVSVLFTDIRGFTALSEKFDPAELSVLLNHHYFTPIDNIIFRHKGTVDKHIGDSVMGIFGAPLRGDNDPLGAVLAALEIQEKMAAINQEINEVKQRLDVGIGIATGEAMAGIFGSPRKKEYTVFGAAVNLASRLENMAAAGEILICENTMHCVEDRIVVENIPSALIRGLSLSPAVYRVLSCK
ncbi:MAG: response regulator [Syntrophales bacterium]|jgi:adenylate cyclase|nr:response regulator [Syntrophales bacterium]